jgi:hypothetical protein
MRVRSPRKRARDLEPEGTYKVNIPSRISIRHTWFPLLKQRDIKTDKLILQVT